MKKIMNFNFGVFTIIIVVIVVGLLSIIAATRQPEPLVDPWPSFTMVFEEYRYPNGYPENSAHEPIKDYDTWKLEYINLRNWKLTLMDSTYQPERIGEWSSFDGEVYRSYSSILKAIEEIPNKEVVIPNDWLAPGRADRLTESGYIVAEQTDEFIHYVLTVLDFPCSEGPPSCPSKKTNYVYTSEYVFNSYGIPTEVIDKLDDILARHILAVEVVINEDAK